MAELKPCPFCGGEVVFRESMETIDEVTIEVYCLCCRMTFKHTQDFAYSRVARIALNDSFSDLWNRRNK